MYTIRDIPHRSNLRRLLRENAIHILHRYWHPQADANQRTVPLWKRGIKAKLNLQQRIYTIFDTSAACSE